MLLLLMHNYNMQPLDEYIAYLFPINFCLLFLRALKTFKVITLIVVINSIHSFIQRTNYYFSILVIKWLNDSISHLVLTYNNS